MQEGIRWEGLVSQSWSRKCLQLFMQISRECKQLRVLLRMHWRLQKLSYKLRVIMQRIYTKRLGWRDGKLAGPKLLKHKLKLMLKEILSSSRINWGNSHSKMSNWRKQGLIYWRSGSEKSR